MKLRNIVLAGVALLTSLGSSPLSVAYAQTNWPMEKPVTLLWPFGAGGDMVGRTIAEALTAKFGQQFIIDNRPGAAGNIATALAAEAEPDGYTLVFAFPGPAANNANTFASLPYDPLTDFTHIMRVTSGSMILVAKTSLEANTLPEMVELAKAQPGMVTAGMLGQGSYGQFLAYALADLEGLEFTFVPYNGSGDLLTDHINQSLDISFNSITANYVPMINDGQIKSLGIAAPERSELFPDVPTFKEQGVDLELPLWVGLMGPKGIPDDVVQAIHSAVHEILTTDEKVIDTLASIGSPSDPTDPAAFHQQILDEYARWKPVIEAHDIRVE